MSEPNNVARMERAYQKALSLKKRFPLGLWTAQIAIAFVEFAESEIARETAPDGVVLEARYTGPVGDIPMEVESNGS